jgi:hypothetical protein
MIDFRKPEETIPLLELALTLHPDTLARWPNICFWLALANERLDRLEKALEYAEQGLAQRPGHVATTMLKSHLLRRLSRRDPAYRASAHAFWEHQLEAEPLNFDARKELVHCALESADEMTAWRLIDESFGALDVHDVCSLRHSTFTPETCLRALRCLPQYAHFRSLQPVSEYWDVSEPLYDLPFDPPPADLLDAALRTYFAVPFGAGWKFLNSAKDRNDSATLVAFFDVVRDGIGVAASQAARSMAQIVSGKENGVEALAGKTTEVMMFNCRMSPIDVSICWPSHLVHLGAFTLACSLNSPSRLESGAETVPASASFMPCSRSLLGGVGIVRAPESGGIRKLRAELYSIRKSTGCD